MLLWMSRPLGKALLSGLAGDAELGGDSGPGGVVLTGPDYGGGELITGGGELVVRVSE